MTDLSITPANVIAGSSARVENGWAAATVTAFQAVYKEAATGRFKLSDNDSATAEVRSCYGVSLHASLAGQPLTVARGGDITVGAILTKGAEYYVSGTPGGICPRADVTTGDDPIRIGIALSTSVLRLDIADAGITL